MNGGGSCGGGPPSSAATVSPSCAAHALRSDASPSPSFKNTGAANAPQQQVPWLAQLFVEHPDSATAVADFLDMVIALDGIGATARAVRVAVKAAMPRLGIKGSYDETAKPKLEESGRLLHLIISSYIIDTDWVEKMLNHGLSARLHSLGGLNHSVLSKCEKGWAQLRRLDVAFDDFFLSSAEHYPRVVCPQLRLLALSVGPVPGASSSHSTAAPFRRSRGSHRPHETCGGNRDAGRTHRVRLNGGFGVHMHPPASAA